MKFRLAWLGLAVVGVTASSTALAGISGSKHDLDSAGTVANGEICVFCHTPHGADTGASAPLWNKALPTTTYQRYSSLGTATLDGAEVTVGSVSLACLSCHDGTQAMDVVINQPGRGGYNSAGARISGGTINEITGSGPIPNLTSDLRDDHPISIQYAGGACQGTSADCIPSSATSGDKDFVDAQFELINGNPQWWVDTDQYSLQQDGNNLQTGAANIREKTDMILYTRDFSATTTADLGPSVECASCHDPHEDTLRPVQFMRISNANSGVCLACHIK